MGSLKSQKRRPSLSSRPTPRRSRAEVELADDCRAGGVQVVVTGMVRRLGLDSESLRQDLISIWPQWQDATAAGKETL